MIKLDKLKNGKKIRIKNKNNKKITKTGFLDNDHSNDVIIII